MRGRFGRFLFAALAACGVVACGEGSGTESGAASTPAPVDTRSAERRRFDNLGVETLLVYRAGRVRATGRFLARKMENARLGIYPSPEVTVVVFRGIDGKQAERAAELGVGAEHAYLLLDPGTRALDVDLLAPGMRFEKLREVDAAAKDEELAKALGMKIEPPPAGAERGLAFMPDDDVRLNFFLSMR